MPYYTLGIDIGGTHTDAVVVDQQCTLTTGVKVATTQPIEKGVGEAIAKCLQQARLSPAQIEAVFIGTTHATNALLEARNLLRVGCLRLAGQRPQAPSPGVLWPQQLRQQVIAATATVGGGYECDGRPITPLQKAEVLQAVERLLQQGVEAFAVTSAFAPLNGAQEQQVARWIAEIAGPQLPITLSHCIGGIGFIERENATILNSALVRVIQEGFGHLEREVQRQGILANLWMIQNNGSAIDCQEATRYPIKTISAGPTNSFVGAARLVNAQQAVVVDMGGTSTDIGFIEGGYARRSSHCASIGGVTLNFPLPDNLSLGIGGGSVITRADAMQKVSVGPYSCARLLKEQSQAFGGRHLTLTDVALCLGLFDMPGADLANVQLTEASARAIAGEIWHTIQMAIIKMQGKHRGTPIIAVGGAAPFLQGVFGEVMEGQIPPHADVANAYGAALAEITATVDCVVSLGQREQILDQIKREAWDGVIAKGGDREHIRIVEQSILPYAYSTQMQARVVVTAAGPRSKRHMS